MEVLVCFSCTPVYCLMHPTLETSSSGDDLLQVTHRCGKVNQVQNIIESAKMRKGDRDRINQG